jgi:hypothetical protein
MSAADSHLGAVSDGNSAVVHVAGDYVNGIQCCKVCGLVLVPPPEGFRPGALIAIDGFMSWVVLAGGLYDVRCQKGGAA